MSISRAVWMVAIATGTSFGVGCEGEARIDPGPPAAVTLQPEGVNGASETVYADAHFHLTNYVGQGAPLSQILSYMGATIVRSTVMPIPLSQRWDYFEHFAQDRTPPTYYLGPKAELHYNAFVDAMVAHEVAKLSQEDRQRLDPMITGFDPMDMYAADHLRRVLLMYPGVFSGVGEFSVHKELVSDKLAGELVSFTAGADLPPDAIDSKVTLYNPSLSRILDFGEESGLLMVLHNDIYEAKVRYDGQVIALSPSDVYTKGLKALCRASPRAKVIWAHTGLGRFVTPQPDHLEAVADVLEHCPAWAVDISWDLVQQYILSPTREQPSFDAWVMFILRYQDRILFGSDNVFYKRTTIDEQGVITLGRRQNPTEFGAVFLAYRPLWEALGPSAARKLRRGNYERLFDEARASVRAWEQTHAGEDIWDY